MIRRTMTDLNHQPIPGPGYWEWRCLACGQAVNLHPSLGARVWRWLKGAWRPTVAAGKATSRPGANMIRHRLTDPACLYFRHPRTFIGRWLFERGRGRPCHVCVPPPM